MAFIIGVVYIIYKYISDTSLYLISFRNFYLDCVCSCIMCVCLCTRMCTMEYMQRSENNFWNLSLSIHL